MQPSPPWRNGDGTPVAPVPNPVTPPLWARRATWPPSRRAARWSRSTSVRTSMPWVVSSTFLLTGRAPDVSPHDSPGQTTPSPYPRAKTRSRRSRARWRRSAWRPWPAERDDRHSTVTELSGDVADFLAGRRAALPRGAAGNRPAPGDQVLRPRPDPDLPWPEDSAFLPASVRDLERTRPGEPPGLSRDPAAGINPAARQLFPARKGTATDR